MGVVYSLAETLNIGWGLATDSSVKTLKDKVGDITFRRAVVSLAGDELADRTGISKNLFTDFIKDAECMAFAIEPEAVHPPANNKPYERLQAALAVSGETAASIASTFTKAFETVATSQAEPIQRLILQKLNELQRSGMDARNEQVPAAGHINLPPRRAPNETGKRLVGRDGALTELAELLGRANAPVTVHALAGMGGIGKSALAAEYCHLNWELYTFVWWVNGASAASVLDSYAPLARYLGIDAEGDELLSAVDGRLRTLDGWLAVFDDVPNREAWDELRPDASTGTFVLTSRDPFRWENTIELHLLDRNDALEWIVDSYQGDSEPAELSAAADIADRLDGLALALSMATAYIRETGCRLSSYLQQLREKPEGVLDDADSLEAYERTVYETWKSSIDQLTTDNEVTAVKMIEIMSFYAPRRIPIRLFLSDVFGEDEATVQRAIRALRRFSLVEQQTDYLNVHGLVQDVTRYDLANRGAATEQPAPA